MKNILIQFSRWGNQVLNSHKLLLVGWLLNGEAQKCSSSEPNCEFLTHHILGLWALSHTIQWMVFSPNFLVNKRVSIFVIAPRNVPKFLFTFSMEQYLLMFNIHFLSFQKISHSLMNQTFHNLLSSLTFFLKELEGTLE